MNDPKDRFQKRFWEIDFMRGIAIIMMITFHSAFNLYYFDLFDINIDSTPWWLLARSTATIFIFLVGTSLTLSYSKAKRSKSRKGIFAKYIIRGFKIFFWGIFITVITYLFLGDAFVRFGILHFIGLSIIIALPFLRFKKINIIIGSVIVIIGYYIESFTVETNWLMWIGLRPASFYTVDYFPLLPWFGLILFGIFAGNSLYPDHERRFELPDLSDIGPIKIFSFLGKHSLLIYLLHQPVIIILMIIFGIIDISVFL
ncbi:MAG: heparan-alpha-glucosaminide N-acetyltransferase [Thermoplasmatota archaeon]